MLKLTLYLADGTSRTVTDTVLGVLSRVQFAVRQPTFVGFTWERA